MTPDDAPRAGRREWLGLAVIALPCLVYSMDMTVLNLAVPAITAALKPSSTELLWIVDIYGFLVAGALVTMGTLGDRIGRRRLLLFGATAFGLASALAAFSVSAEMLIATRALLGLAGATLAPSTLSLIRNMFLDQRQRTLAVGLWATSYSVGAGIGPALGGVLLEHFWWGSVFLIGVPVMILLLALGPVLLPEFRAPKDGRLDLTSAALSLVGVLALIYGIKRIAEDGPSWLAGLAILAGSATIIVFVRRQRQLTDPLIDLRLFQVPAFSAALATNLIAVFLAVGPFLYIAQYLQLVLGLPPLEAGLWTIPSSIGFTVGSLLAPTLVRWARPAFVIAASLILAAIGLIVLTRAEGAFALATIVTGSVVLALGLAPVATLATDLIIGAAQPERAGAAAALSETSAELGGALGIAILGSIGTAIYRGQVASALPAGIPPEATAAARQTLGGALAVARELTAPLAAMLDDLARQAFTESLVVTATISAALAVGTAILAAVALRRVPGVG